MNAIQSLSYSKWRCQYPIVFAPKYRGKEIYGKIKADIGVILRQLCKQKKAEIIEAEACPDHIHMLVSISLGLSIAQFMGFLKGKSSLMIFDRHANLKYKYGSRHFGCRGYYVDTVGRNKNAIAISLSHGGATLWVAGMSRGCIPRITTLPRRSASFADRGSSPKTACSIMRSLPNSISVRRTP